MCIYGWIESQLACKRDWKKENIENDDCYLSGIHIWFNKSMAPHSRADVKHSRDEECNQLQTVEHIRSGDASIYHKNIMAEKNIRSETRTSSALSSSTSTIRCARTWPMHTEHVNTVYKVDASKRSRIRGGERESVIHISITICARNSRMVSIIHLKYVWNFTN